MWCSAASKRFLSSRSSILTETAAKYGTMSALFPQQFISMLVPQYTNPLHSLYLQNASSPLSIMEKLTSTVDNTPLLSAVLQQELHNSATKAVEPSKNRYGRPYISGRPLLTCDRKKIVELFEGGMKKINIAKCLGITHSCVSKVLRRYKETGLVEARVCRTASCACPGSADQHDARYCKHLKNAKGKKDEEEAEVIQLPFTIEYILKTFEQRVIFTSLSANDN